MFLKIGYPQIIHFNRAFHYKSSILGYPYFWKHPSIYREICGFIIEVACILPHFCFVTWRCFCPTFPNPRCKGEEREESKKGQFDTYLGGGFKDFFVKSLFD